MNAVALEMLVRQYHSTEEFKVESPSEREAADFLERNELMAPYGGLTKRGEVHVRALLDAPLPEPDWRSFLEK